MTSTKETESGRSDWWVDRLRVTSRAGAGVTGGIILAVMMTASIALGVTSDDKPAAAKQRPAAQTNDSYLTPVGTLLQDPALPRPSLTGDTGTAGVPPTTSPRPTKPVAQPPADTGQITTYSGGAGTLSPAGIATLAIGAGCSASQAVVATAVAIAESGGSPAAQGDVTLMDATWDWSAGLWQVRGLRAQRGTGQLRDSVANHDPATNAGAMYAISSGCSSWTPWTTYTRGTYESFLTIARQAVAYVTDYQRAHGGQLPTVAPRDPGAPIPSGGGGVNAAPGASAAAGTPAGRVTPARGSTARSAPASKGAATTGAGAPGGAGGAATTPTPSGSATPTTTTPPPLLPTKLPTKLPPLLPTKSPTKLPTNLPTKLPIKLPTTLPSIGLGLP